MLLLYSFCSCYKVVVGFFCDWYNTGVLPCYYVPYDYPISNAVFKTTFKSQAFTENQMTCQKPVIHGCVNKQKKVGCFGSPKICND